MTEVDSREWWKAMYEAREREAHELSERIIRLTAAPAPSPSSAAAMRQGLEALQLTRRPGVVNALSAIEDREILVAIASLRAALSAELEKTK